MTHPLFDIKEWGRWDGYIALTHSTPATLTRVKHQQLVILSLIFNIMNPYLHYKFNAYNPDMPL